MSTEKKTLDTEAHRKFVSDLTLMKVRAMELGFYATGQRLDPAIRMVGFEMGGDISECIRHEAAQEASLPR